MEKLVGQTSGPIYDRESMLRELLGTKVREWISGGRFYTNALRDIKAVVDDIQCSDGTAAADTVLPEDLKRLHCIPFEELTTTNRREMLNQAFKFAGITRLTGNELLGQALWSEVSQLICRQEDAEEGALSTTELNSSAPTKAEVPTDWEQKVLLSVATELLTDETFSVLTVDKVGYALTAIRKSRGMKPHTVPETTRAVLSSLHCQDYKDMGEMTRAGLKPAIWSVLGLDEEIGPVAFGKGWEDLLALTLPVTSTKLTPLAVEEVNDDQAVVPKWRKLFFLALASLFVGGCLFSVLR